MGIILGVVCLAGFLVGVLISGALGAVAAILVGRAAKERRHRWWIFGITTALVLPCALILIHSRFATINLPHSVDLKNLFLNFAGYGGSLGFAASLACAITLLIPGGRRSALDSRSPTQAVAGPPPLPSP